MSSSHLGTGTLGTLTLAGLGGESGPPVESQPLIPSKGPTVNAVVRLQALSGTWETCGADRAIGVDPESITLTANEWGFDKASFDLHRSPIAIWPDIGAFAPVEVEIGGVIAWKGRINDTPLKLGPERVINIQCEGWQYQTDDDTFQRVYVHSRLTDWKDVRSLLDANLATCTTAAQVQTGNGQIVLAWPAETAANGRAAVILDLGAYTAAKRLVVDWSITASATGPRAFYVAVKDDATGEFTSEEVTTVYSANGASSGTFAVTFALPQRYVYLMHDATGHTPTADETLKITRALVFADTAHEESNASILKASTVIPDALERATMLLSDDHSQIMATSFDIPDLAIEKQTTPREAIEAVNAYHNWITRLDAQERMVFRPRPTAPLFEIGAWAGSDIEDSSANSGAEIYNRAVIEATGPDGSPVTIERSAAQQPGARSATISAPAPENPSFAVNLASWSASAGTLTRDTTIFSSSPASGKWIAPKAAILTEAFAGTFKKGTAYKLVLEMRAGGPNLTYIKFGTSSDSATIIEELGAFESFVAVAISWTPKAATSGVTLTITNNPSFGTNTFWIDDLSLSIIAPTLIDRRNFRRTKVIQVSSAITAVEGNQLGDTFLRGHTTTPFKGDAKVVPGGARTVLGGQQVHPSLLLLHTQELIRLSHMIDPDTGGIGRDGTIANVTYTHADQTADVSLDENRTNFDSLLNRLAAVQGANG